MELKYCTILRRVSREQEVWGCLIRQDCKTCCMWYLFGGFSKAVVRISSLFVIGRWIIHRNGSHHQHMEDKDPIHPVLTGWCPPFLLTLYYMNSWCRQRTCLCGKWVSESGFGIGSVLRLHAPWTRKLTPISVKPLRVSTVCAGYYNIRKNDNLAKNPIMLTKLWYYCMHVRRTPLTTSSTTLGTSTALGTLTLTLTLTLTGLNCQLWNLGI
jgi:hypothetical protein